MFEFPNFRKGTEIVANAIADSDAFSIAGGGDTWLLSIYSALLTKSLTSLPAAAHSRIRRRQKLPAVVMLEERAKQ